MIDWTARPQEERTLLNPAFCATLLWCAAAGHAKRNDALIRVEEAFLILPLVLPASTRGVLPTTTKTSLPVWLEGHGIERRLIAARAKLLVPFTKSALLFGGVHSLLKFEGSRLRASSDWSGRVQKVAKASDEVRMCVKKAEFVGKWFDAAGSSATILALVGLRP